MARSVEIIGGRELRATLARLGPMASREALRAMERAMRPLHRRAIEEAPKDTGDLAHHVTLEAGNRGMQTSASVVVEGVRYAAPVELGAPAIHREPDPFLIRAVDAEGRTALLRATNDIAEAIEQLAGH